MVFDYFQFHPARGGIRRRLFSGVGLIDIRQFHVFTGG